MTARQYTKFNQNELLSYAEKILKSKNGNISEFGTSGYGRTLLELFTAFSEGDAYRTEVAWREGWLSESTQLSSKYIGARDLGYSVRRNVPARAVMAVSLKRTGTKPSTKVMIPKGTIFDINGSTLVALDDMEYTYQRNLPNFEDGIMELTSGRAILAEGQFKNESFFSSGDKNQEFFIFDPLFSNWFGDGDPNYNELAKMSDRVNMFTTISSDAGLIDNYDPVKGYEDKIFWRISRRGLFDPTLNNEINDITNFNPNSNLTNNFTSLVETANDGNIRITFGDGINAAIPFGKIDVRYFQSNGQAGNLSNVAGTEITTNSSSIKIMQSNGKESDLSIDDITFSLITDVMGGINTEDAESITKNASKIYSNLDRLGNGTSYEIFLSREFNVKYANAYGEGVLSRYNKDSISDFKYANTVRYTLLKELYKETDGNYFTTDSFDYYLDGYKVNGLIYSWEYDYSELPSQDEINRLEVDYNTINENINSANLQIIMPVSNNRVQPNGISFRSSLNSSVSDELELPDGRLLKFYAIVELESVSDIIENDEIIISGVSQESDGTYKVLYVDNNRVYVRFNSNVNLTTSYNVIRDTTIISNNEFFKNYVKVDVPKSLVPNTLFSANLQPSDFIVEGSELDLVNKRLSTRSQLTLKDRHFYQPAIVHVYSMNISLVVSSGNSFTEVKSKVINDIYKYLKENTQFASPIYRSRIESIIMEYPEVIGVNLSFVPKENGYEEIDLTRNTWLSEETSQIIEQNSLNIDGMEINLSYTYNKELPNGQYTEVPNKSVKIQLPSQYKLRSDISNYYKSTFTYIDSNGSFKLKDGINIEQLNKFTAYIWTTSMNEVYTQLLSQYKEFKSNGDNESANEIYHVIEAIRGWDVSNGSLQFKDTKSIIGMTEDSSKLFFNYIKYTLEYIKLVRNVFEYTVSKKLIDKNNNISDYTLENQIAQFQINTSDISIQLGK
jgi:hypothetical protein